MTLLEKKKANRLMLDDTVPLICQIEGINKKEHVVCAFGSITDQYSNSCTPDSHPSTKHFTPSVSSLSDLMSDPIRDMCLILLLGLHNESAAWSKSRRFVAGGLDRISWVCCISLGLLSWIA